MLTVGAVRLVR